MRKWIVAAVLLGLWVLPASAERATYTRRFVNRTTQSIAFYRFDFGAGVWILETTVPPFLSAVERDVPRHPTERILWGADLGLDGKAIDLTRNDFGNVDWRWVISEDRVR